MNSVAQARQRTAYDGGRGRSDGSAVTLRICDHAFLSQDLVGRGAIDLARRISRRNCSYGTDFAFSGVWFSEEPMDANDGVVGEALLAVDIPQGIVDEYEWIEDGKFAREWLVPAALVNAHAKVKIVEQR